MRNINKETYTCVFCGKSYSKSMFGYHLSVKHNITTEEQRKEYYDKYIKTKNEGICKYCGNESKFISIARGYECYCKKCGKLYKEENRRNTNLKKYGYETPFESPEQRKKAEQTCIEKYGAANIMQTEIGKQRSSESHKRTLQHMINTNRERYGVDFSTQNKEVHQKCVNTMIDRYGVDNYSKINEYKEKVKKTNLQRYGVEWNIQSESSKKKQKQTMIDRYGVEYALQNKELQDKAKQTMIDRYGVEYALQNKELQDKAKQTTLKNIGVEYPMQSNDIKQITKQINLKKYGIEHPMQLSKFKDKIKQTNIKKYGVENPMQLSLFIEKTKETNLKKYGTEYYFQSEIYLQRLKEVQQKMHDTKKKNGTFNTSQIEEEFAKYLTENNYQYIRQYKSDLYPFDCDFYLPTYNLYIEINAHWTHGYHIFNPIDSDDMDKLNKWQNKHTDYYNNAIKVWTISDVHKQKTAKEHNLNYFVTYSNDIDEVINQFEIYIKNNCNN